MSRDLDIMINAEDKLLKPMKHDELSKRGKQIVSIDWENMNSTKIQFPF